MPFYLLAFFLFLLFENTEAEGEKLPRRSARQVLQLSHTEWQKFTSKMQLWVYYEGRANRIF